MGRISVFSEDYGLLVQRWSPLQVIGVDDDVVLLLSCPWKPSHRVVQIGRRTTMKCGGVFIFRPP